MPLFLSEEELRLCAHDTALVVEKAEHFTRDLYHQIESIRAEADAASIAAEQTSALLEQRYLALSSDLSGLQSLNAQLSASLEQRLSELAEAQDEKHQLHLKALEKTGEIERLTVETSELHKSKRQLLELLEQKDIEIGEKNATIQCYLDKIVDLTENAASNGAKLHKNDAELARCHVACTRLLQEKELIEKHNQWLNEELTVKVNSLIELRKTHMDYEADMSAKLADVEKQFSESSKTLKRSKESAMELESKLKSLEKELCSCKNAAATNEEHLNVELSTATKLVDLYKEGSEEWSKKATDLEGVIKALETHLGQVENDFKEKLEKESSAKKEFEMEIVHLKDKLDKCEVELENSRKAGGFSLVPVSGFRSDVNMEEIWIDEFNDQNDNGRMLVPKIPTGVSGTALVASLLRDGWSLAKIYEKYQESVDALRHEKWGRKHVEAILERVLHEIEAKAELVLGERVEHEKLVEAYTSLSHKLQQALSEHDNFENTIQKLKAELKRSERDYSNSQKEITDLQKQVTVLLKECRDIQLHCGVASSVYPGDTLVARSAEFNDRSEVEKLTFKDINGLVEQNVQLRSLVHSLSNHEEKRDAELRESFQLELQKVTDEAAAKVETVLRRSEEQAHMIEALHNSVAMYRRLYEEERRSHVPNSCSTESLLEDRSKDLVHLFEGSQEAAKKASEQLDERARNLEEDVARSKSELMSLRLERDKMIMEVKIASERLERSIKESEHQREETNGVLARNVELSQLLCDYQRRLRETSNSLLGTEEHSRKLSMEVSILKHEKEILLNSEKRATDEVSSLSERLCRLQSSLDTIQSVEEVRENARATERRKIEEHIKRIEREWAEAKKELQEERDRVRMLAVDREKSLENSVRQVEEIGKKLADAWHAVSSAESRAAVAEARCSDLEDKAKALEVVEKSRGHDESILSSDEALGDFWKVKEEMQKLKEEAQANKDYMLQYKEIALTNEIALKELESAHEEFKAEAAKLKKSLEAEVNSFREKVSKLETDYLVKSGEASSAIAEKEEALCSALANIEHLNEENLSKMTQVLELETQISALKDKLEEEHQRWRNAQNNYERQVILQSETIQEMTRTSQALTSLQDEVSELRKLSDTREAENEILKRSLESERSVLEKSKNEAGRNYNELNEQNKILHNHLETLHIKLADKEHSSTRISVASDSQFDSDFQDVINYLRRSKEIAETEISLLRQEKLRLQSQLESALKASETAQALLHSECENARATLFTEEEFKSLQFQVREINLLRESNTQLREENKHNFEECQKFREAAQIAKMEAENVGAFLRDKEVEVDVYRKENEMLKIEKGHLENKINKLLENLNNIDVVDYRRVKDELRQLQVKLKENDDEVELSKNLISEKQEHISSLQQEILKCQLQLEEKDKKINDILQKEETQRLSNERLRKLTSHWKKKIESITKEKEELNKEKDVLLKEKEELNKERHALLKQLEDYSKSGKRDIGDGTSEQAMKEKEREKDTRIQMLEKTLERLREDKQKEKSWPEKALKTVVDSIQIVNQERKKLEEEIDKHKHHIANLLESSAITVSQLPPDSGLEEPITAYTQAVSNFEEAVGSIPNERLGTSPFPTDTLPSSSVMTAAGQQVSSQPLRLTSNQGKATEQRERRFSFPKSTIDARKRKLVRPSLEQSEEPTVDIEMAEVECSTTKEEGKPKESHEQETQGSISLPAPSSSSQKRLASSVSESREEFSTQAEDSSDSTPLLKKLKGSDSPPEGVEGHTGRSAEFFNEPTSTEGADGVGGISSQVLANMIIDSAKGQDLDINKEPTQAQPKEPLVGTNQDDELKNESDAVSEEFLVKPREIMELPDDSLVSGEEQDTQQCIVNAEDEREEGELVPGSPEPLEGGDSEEGQLEPVAGDAAGVGGGIAETGDGVEFASIEVLNEEKNENSDPVEEAVDVSDKPNSNDHEVERTPLTSGTPEGSPSIHAETSVSEQGTSGVTAGREAELRGATSGSTTIVLGERARQRALLRQAGMGVLRSSPPRGRGRASGSYRAPLRDAGHGARRGPRSGRGHAPGEREQS